MTRKPGVLFAAGALVLAVPVVVKSPYLLHIGVMSAIYVVLVQSLNLVLGYCGLLSLATPAFFGVGAYVAALAALHSAWDAVATFALACLGGLAASFVIGFPSLRVSRHAFVIVTLAATLLLQLVALNWENVTRGSLGLADIPPPRFFGFAVDGNVRWYYVAAGTAALALWLTRRIVTSRFGRAMVAARDNEPLSGACGMDVFRTRLFAFCLSGALAALGGALYAHFITYIDPGVFGFSTSEALLIMIILGGAGSLPGPALAAVVFTVLPELLRLTPELRSLLYGAILLAAVLYRRKRLFG